MQKLIINGEQNESLFSRSHGYNTIIMRHYYHHVYIEEIVVEQL